MGLIGLADERPPSLAKATIGTLHRRLINVAARAASSARKLTLHRPTRWPWEHASEALFTATFEPPAITSS